MPELPADFDLKLMPDWLKEPPAKNPYADYEGVQEERRGRGRGDDWGGRGRSGGGERRGRPGGPRDGARREGRSGPAGPQGRRDQGKRPGGPGGPRDERRGKPDGRPRQEGGHEGPHGREQREQGPAVQPANVTVEFFPDEGCAVSIARQIKSTHRAYSLFELARMFLARPERHRLRITAKTVEEPLHQVGDDGPVAMDRATAERAAFSILRRNYYVEAVEQREAPKGNFSNVARCRANGMLLGPTNYHGYQPALRRLYEERFSRRMPFPDFLREIEVVSDPALVEQWKQQLSQVTVFRLKPVETPVEKEPVPAVEKKEEAAPGADAEPAVEAPTESTPAAVEVTEAAEGGAEGAQEEPAAEAPEALAGPVYEGPVFHSLSEVEQHFRENYLPGLARTGSTFHLTGTASRSLPDRGIAAAVRQGWEQERGFPGQMMHQLRQQFSRAGLHVFKHRKRMQFVSLIRPVPMEDGNLSPSVAEILHVIREKQNCNRATLAAAILGTDESAVDQARKTTLATDLRWLIETGHVIEFSDGRLELPVAPAKPAEEPKEKAAEARAAEKEEEPAAVAEAEADSGPVAETAPEEPAGETPTGEAPVGEV